MYDAYSGDLDGVMNLSLPELVMHRTRQLREADKQISAYQVGLQDLYLTLTTAGLNWVYTPEMFSGEGHAAEEIEQVKRALDALLCKLKDDHVSEYFVPPPSRL